MDRNLLHISYEAGILEDTWIDAYAPKNKDMFLLSVDPEDAPEALPEAVIEALHAAVDEMGNRRPFRGYAPE